jgi:hypothetical protein
MKICASLACTPDENPAANAADDPDKDDAPDDRTTHADNGDGSAG